MVMTTCRRAGEIERGSFTFETPTDEEVTRPERLAADEEAAR
jgi:hypothetical protein